MPRHSNKLVSIEEKVTIILKVHIIGIDLVEHIFHFVGHNLSGREDFRSRFMRRIYCSGWMSTFSTRWRILKTILEISVSRCPTRAV